MEKHRREDRVHVVGKKYHMAQDIPVLTVYRKMISIYLLFVGNQVSRLFPWKYQRRGFIHEKGY